MTAKRFKLGYVCGDFGLIDNNEWIDLHSMSENSEKNVQLCINKMNELAEENEQLQHDATILIQANQDYRKENESLKEQREKLFFRERDTKNRWRELKQENEELKKQMERLYNYFVDWHGDIMGANQFSEMWDDVKEDEDWED